MLGDFQGLDLVQNVLVPRALEVSPDRIISSSSFHGAYLGRKDLLQGDKSGPLKG